MKKHLLALAAIATLVTSTAAVAQSAAAADGRFMVRARAVNLQSANGDNTGLGLTINNKWLPEVDISYFFTPNFAAELILTYPQSQTVYSNGTAIGSFYHLPPTLTAQYHFTNFTGFKPYVGAGLNYTKITNVNILNGGANLSRDSFGPALQVGVDIPVAKGIYLNLDVKKVWISADVFAGGNKAGTFKVDPVLWGLGVGYRF